MQSSVAFRAAAMIFSNRATVVGGWRSRLEAEVARLEHGHPLRAPASEHRAWLICRLALVVGDAVEAEDVAEQTLLRASDQSQLPDGSDVLPRLMVDGIRHAIDEGRRRRSSFFAIRETDEDWARTADPELWRAWSGLDRRTRAALVLSVLDGDSETGVAEILGVPPATVMTWRSRGKAGLLDVVAPSQATDTFDADLRARLLALERAVPLAPEPAPLAPVSRPTPRAPMARSSLLAAAVAIGVVAAIAFAIPGRGGPPAT